LKKIKKILSNAFSRPRVNIYCTIVIIGVLTVALLLTGCGGQNFFSDVGPAWSPDGSKIAFVSQQNENKINFFVMNADGSNKINLTGN